MVQDVSDALRGREPVLDVRWAACQVPSGPRARFRTAGARHEVVCFRSRANFPMTAFEHEAVPVDRWTGSATATRGSSTWRTTTELARG